MDSDNSIVIQLRERARPLIPEWRRLPVGAEPAPGGGVHFRVWAPSRESIDVVLYAPDSSDEERRVRLARDGEYFAALVSEAKAGTRYAFRIDGGDPFADPASRYQPDGPHGPSEVIDPGAFAWSDAAWVGPDARSLIIYEMHIGTFTADGTWLAAMDHLSELAELGVNMLEIMPVAEFAGRFGWGYDGVNLFAPFHGYGCPEDFRAFIDHAHRLGLSVILDVVYNHFGPDGNSAPHFSERYATQRHKTDWGEAINFDGPGSKGTREFFLANAAYWVNEFHLDGLRLDATQNMYDESPTHIIAEIAATVRAAAAPRVSYLVAENEPQDVRLLQSRDCGGYGLDAAWNDDWHHSAAVALTGRDEAYYVDYAGTAREFVAAARFGYLYQGQWYSWQTKPRGVPGLDMVPTQFVHFLENHDQVANSIRGERLSDLSSARRVRALTALLLLGPQTPMLFQGQEWGTSTPFLFFADHNEQLRKLVYEGRSAFLAQFQSIGTGSHEMRRYDPGDPETFWRSRLDRSERESNSDILALHRDLIALRKREIATGSPHARRVDGATLSDDAFVIRYIANDGHDLLLLVTLGKPMHLRIMSEPLLAPPRTGRWGMLWSSEDPRYGGFGLPALDPSMKDWSLPADCAVLLGPRAPGANE
ncbi:MAG TPA: malto-oligosyltrehalose trehalohydrolase [Gemmatimonadaceae bacterium]|nr:malto-oligosyltrehalose trehalohydrolase [Gemmatimonadaceae bacterium]